ncbi:MAG: hypothetical protein BalsKO_05440 [Balneolaceae bacterium]
MKLKHDVLVLGSQNSKEQDQELSRDQIRPVQILSKNGELKAIDFFNSWGSVGVSSFASHPEFKDELFVSVNEEIRRLNLITGEYNTLDITKLADIHDINFLGDTLWISNTEFDEAVEYDIRKNELVKRISLAEYRVDVNELEGEAEDIKDQFHCNQVFRDYEGNLCVLIHNITGWQYFRIVLEMLIRKQGDGGVINLDEKEVLKLKLQSPHSVRKINNEYWIQDSSDKTTKIFDRNWKLKSSILTNGFGRGVDFSEEDGVAYIGISATRKRYLKVIPAGGKLDNRIMVVDISTKKEIQLISIPNIEQMDNVYILDQEFKTKLEKLDEL